jgi:hypothetical protein
LSGNVTGSPNEHGNTYLIFSGNFVPDIPDFNYSRFILSGKVVNSAPDAPPLISIISGSVVSGDQDITMVRSLISGKFLPVNSYNSNISYNMLSFSGLVNKIISNVEFDENCGIRYGFNSYFSTHG